MDVHEILVQHRPLAYAPGDVVCACDQNWRGNASYRSHLAEVLDTHMQEREVQAVRYANQSIVDSIDVPDTYLFVDHLTEYANRMESHDGR